MAQEVRPFSSTTHTAQIKYGGARYSTELSESARNRQEHPGSHSLRGHDFLTLPS